MVTKATQSPPGKRLQKILAEAGICSRREAEVLISDGKVKVNGKVAELGQRADPAVDDVLVGRKRVPPPARPGLTIALHKPRGFICSHADPHNSRTIYELLPAELRKHRLVCPGRLDKDSEGLVVLTASGDLAQTLAHPSNEVIKRYRVIVHREFDPMIIPALLKGRELEGEWLRFLRVILPKAERAPRNTLEIHLGHGHKREIRRLLESHGYFVKRLKRVQVGGLLLKGLGAGQHRVLSPREIKLLLARPKKD